jgi:biopolymer transport protein ExbB
MIRPTILLRALRRIGFLAIVASAAVRGDPPTFDEAMKSATTEYRQRAEAAAKLLNQVRARIADEKAPLLRQIRSGEDQLIALQSEVARLDTQHENAAELRHQALQALENVRKSTGYVTTVTRDAFKAATEALAPGEEPPGGDQSLPWQKQLESGESSVAAVDAADFLLGRIDRSLGGYRATGRAMIADTRQVVEGTFVFSGPEVYFQPAAGGATYVVRPHEGSKIPIAYALSGWKPSEAAPFFAGELAPIVIDPSAGKALRLEETRGTVWQHIQRGGVVAFAILFVGLVAILLIAQKLRDLQRMAVDSPAVAQAFLDNVASGDLGAADRAVPTLHYATRELFSVGLRNAGEPKAILEERLQAVLLEQRLQFERRLPLLAVIATASPLMGLLGTVVGMVRTFALITVFGTGNAGKLSSGISEVLVATELGLMVAIPTLVTHGFLAQAVHRRLALLERYALQFTTAVEAGRAARDDKRRAVSA